MIKSMTGYGKGECTLTNGSKITIEIRTLNGKNAEINIKGSVIPKNKELEVRKLITKELFRGTIDLIATCNSDKSTQAKRINSDVFKNYLKQIEKIYNINRTNKNKYNEIIEPQIVSTILRLPDVIESGNEEIDEKDWNKICRAITQALNHTNQYRAIEGKAIQKDLTKHIGNIKRYLEEINKADVKRIPNIKQRLEGKIANSGYKINEERLEQELIFYIEKLDINEEKVRLEQHCNYFIETIKKEEYPGKKLGFILQEIGREINTTGSKANDVTIQKLIVKMKDDLEKLKEQSLNVL